MLNKAAPGVPMRSNIFQKSGWNVELVDVRADPSRMSELETVSGQTKTPTLKNGDFVVADFDVEEFKTALRESPQEASKLGIVL